MHINDLPSVKMFCEVHLYAEDTLLSFESSSVEAIEAAPSQDLDHVVGQFKQNYLVLNHLKTKVMLMGTHQKLSSAESLTVSVNDKDLERVCKFKYLGVILDPCLTWSEHIEYIGNKISSRLGMLCRAPKVIPKEACITLFNAMILPLFD